MSPRKNESRDAGESRGTSRTKRAEPVSRLSRGGAGSVVAETSRSEKARSKRVVARSGADPSVDEGAAQATLARYFTLRRRYTRSVNLERDLLLPETLEGYIPTERSSELLTRIAAALTTPRSVRAWTVTGVYGTGKSACAHVAAALAGAADDPARARALAILGADPRTRPVAATFRRAMGERGLVRAVVTARREPLAVTLVRALARGAAEFWGGRSGRRPAALERLSTLSNAAAAGAPVPTAEIPDLVAELARVSGSGVLVIVDELGKTLEHAARAGDSDDLFLLQRLAELPAGAGDPPVLFLGLLHQSFAGYATGLLAYQRGEWDKIQGRFEDVVFAEAPEQTLRLVAAALHAAPPPALAATIRAEAESWHKYATDSLRHPYIAEVLTPERVASVYPLHPVAALALPALCAKFAQNDRSLFTFLTSQEPHALARFLAETPASHASIDTGVNGPLPTLTLSDVYDYLLDVSGGALAGRPQFQRWTEVHGAVRDAAGLPADEVRALKVIGALNLVTASGPLKASAAMVVAALSGRPWDSQEARRWSEVLDRLVERRIVTYRRQIDEFRIWEGSDYDIDGQVSARLEADRRSLAEVLCRAVPLPPVVAERHSYRTGTLRFFERQFVDDADMLAHLRMVDGGSDGVMAYWVGANLPESVPASTLDGRPLVLVPTGEAPGLAAAARLVAALSALDQEDAALQTDGVARKEVRHRLTIAREALLRSVRDAFEAPGRRRVWLAGTWTEVQRLNVALSLVCDRVYADTPVLWNELLNRRELTSQGARARRELLEALLARADRPRLGLAGHGPEVSMYNSVLFRTGIHRPGDEALGPWVVAPPHDAGIAPLWRAVEEFCLGATVAPRTLDQLYAALEAPPYGVKAGVVPVVLAAVLLYHSDDISLYRDGTFVAALGAEHFELLVKQPQRFAVKHFALTGVRWEVFRELETVLVRQATPLPAGIRNATLLHVVRPLVRFAVTLPNVTKRAKTLSPEATAVRDALLSATEPDELVFSVLPRACGHEPFLPASDRSELRRVVVFRRALLRALGELQSHHERVLEAGAARLRDAFGVPPDFADTREHLRVRAQYLVGQVIDRRLRSFIAAAADGTVDERRWLESVLMVVADKPVENWNDEDALALDAQLADLARRFQNLESLQRDVARERRDGFDARQVTITRPDGSEDRRLLWLSPAERPLVTRQVDRLAAELETLPDEHQRHAVALALLERLLQFENANTTTTAGEASPAVTPVQPPVRRVGGK